MEILLADDDPGTRLALAHVLREAGYTVHVARDGNDAWRVFGGQGISILITDWRMPGINGPELIRRVRELGPEQYVYVIALTAQPNRHTIEEAVEAGADDFLTKPVDFKALKARVRAAVRVVELERRLAQRNAELEAAYSRIKRDVEAAADVQRRLLPRSLPRIDEARFLWHYRPCTDLAGDILDIAPLDARHVGFYLLDVSGHGVPAALLSVTLSHLLASMMGRAAAPAGFFGKAVRWPLDPGSVAGQLNERFQFGDSLTQFFTIFYGVLDRQTLELRYASAGHPPPVVLRPSGEATLLEPTGPAVGIIEQARFQERSIRLRPGDRLFVYSDGLSECPNAEGTQFGTARLVNCLQAHARFTPDESLAAVLDDLASWSGGRPTVDDMSCILLEVIGPEAASRPKPPATSGEEEMPLVATPLDPIRQALPATGLPLRPAR